MYSTGTASGPKAVLQALATFAISAGFTVDNDAAYSGGWWLAVHKGSCYLNFVADAPDTQISIYGATGFSVGAGPTAQANTSPNNTNICNCEAGPYTGYHFFSTTSGGAAYLHVVIEKSAGVFAHFHTGALAAVGGASPCIYLHVTNWQYTGYLASFPESGGSFPWSHELTSGWLGVTVDGSFNWFNPNNAPHRSRLPIQLGGLENDSFNKSPNVFNGLAVLLPIHNFAERSSGNIFAYVGVANDVRFLNMKNNAPKDEITIGADTWKIFPMISNNPNTNVGGSPNPSSGNYALAFRKNA